MANDIQIAQVADAIQSVNGKFFKWRDGRGILPATHTTAPIADATSRGASYLTEGGTGVADSLNLVVKGAAGTYAARRVPVFGTDILYIRNAVAKTLANDTSAQSPFTAANDALTVEAATLYHFEGLINLVTGTTSHTVALTFALATATLTNIAYFTEHVSVTDTTLASNDVDHKFTKVATATVVTPAITATGSMIWITGSMLVNAAGTVTPQITFSADPTSTCECQIGSYFMLTKMPSAAQGPWS
jgi:hypothetical protein